ncbi:hypothetical protein ACFSJQ_09155 [Vibrio olivae]
MALRVYLNLPFCAAILYFGKKHIPETKEQHAMSLDGLGTLLFAIIVGLILTSISLGAEDHWSWHIWGLLVVTIPLGVLLWNIERRKEASNDAPLLPPSLLKEPNVQAGMFSLMMLSATFGGFMFVVALTLQSGFQWPAYASGNGFLGLGLSYFAGSLMVANRQNDGKIGVSRCHDSRCCLVLDWLCLPLHDPHPVCGIIDSNRTVPPYGGGRCR